MSTEKPSAVEVFEALDESVFVMMGMLFGALVGAEYVSKMLDDLSSDCKFWHSLGAYGAESVQHELANAPTSGIDVPTAEAYELLVNSIGELPPPLESAVFIPEPK